jgi:hypothetical protein
MKPKSDSCELYIYKRYEKKKKPKEKIYIDDTQGIYAIYNREWTEFDIHARLMVYMGALVDGCVGLNVKSEVTLGIGKRRTIIDIMIFKDNFPVCGIEVKKSKSKTNPAQFKKQVSFYQDFHEQTGIPIYYCQGFNNIKPTAREVHNYIYEQYGIKNANCF